MKVLPLIRDLLQKLNAKNGEEFLRKLKLFLRDELVEKVINYIVSTHRFKVNYSRSISDSVKAGNYGWKNDDITNQNFPSTESGEKEVDGAIYHFNKTTTSPDVIAEMKRDGYRPATMKELLAFGEQNPELQRQFPIVALGSVARLDGSRHVGCLCGSGSERNLRLSYFGNGWLGHCRFLAVRTQ